MPINEMGKKRRRRRRRRRHLLQTARGGAVEGYVQRSAKEWSLGCVKRAPAARCGQGAGITQPRAHSLADSCTVHKEMNKNVGNLFCHFTKLD